MRLPAELHQLSEKEVLAIRENEQKVFPAKSGQRFNARALEQEKGKEEPRGEKRKSGDGTRNLEEEESNGASGDTSSWFEGFGKVTSEEEKAKVELGKQRMWSR